MRHRLPAGTAPVGVKSHHRDPAIGQVIDEINLLSTGDYLAGIAAASATTAGQVHVFHKHAGDGLRLAIGGPDGERAAFEPRELAAERALGPGHQRRLAAGKLDPLDQCLGLAFDLAASLGHLEGHVGVSHDPAFHAPAAGEMDRVSPAGTGKQQTPPNDRHASSHQRHLVTSDDLNLPETGAASNPR